jgi:hypothetical protein
MNQISAFTSLAKDIFSIISAIILGYVAITGLQSWKAQMKGKNKYEIAKKIMLDVLGVRNAIIQLRHPIIYGGEIESAKKNMQDKRDLSVDSITDNRLVYTLRWQRIQQAHDQLEVDSMEGELLFGGSFLQRIVDIRMLVNELNNMLGLFLDLSEKPKLSSSEITMLEKTETFVYRQDLINKTDEYNQRLETSIASIRKLLVNILK